MQFDEWHAAIGRYKEQVKWHLPVELDLVDNCDQLSTADPMDQQKEPHQAKRERRKREGGRGET